MCRLCPWSKDHGSIEASPATVIVPAAGHFRGRKITAPLKLEDVASDGFDQAISVVERSRLH